MRIILLIVFVVYSAACTHFVEAPANSRVSLLDELYDGRSPLTYATELPVSSAQEAMQRGDTAWRGGDIERALFEYIRALDLDRNQSEAFYKIGQIHSLRGNQVLAERSFRGVLQLKADHAGALEGLGLILLEKRAYQEAEEHLARAADNDAKRWRAHNALGIIADLNKDYERAVEHYQAALEVYPDAPKLLNNLGYSEYLAGHWGKAREAFRRALTREPTYTTAWRNLGLLYAREGNYVEALDAFKHVMDAPSAYNDVGYICMLDGRYETAERFFAEAITLAPSYYVTAHENLSRVRNLRRQH